MSDGQDRRVVRHQGATFGVSGLLGREQHGCVVAKPCRSIDELPNFRWTRSWRAAQNPEVTPGRLTDDGPAVVVRVIEYPIIAHRTGQKS